MSVALDAVTKQASNFSSADSNFTHTPSGTPRGVLLFITTMTGSADEIDSTDVTYGGVAMSLVGTYADTAGEPCRVHAYFLGSGIPTGAQTVHMGVTAGATLSKRGYCITLTAAADTAVEDENGTSGDIDDPSVALTTGASTETWVAALIMSGLAAPTSITAGSGFTKNATLEHDHGANCSTVETIDTNDAGGGLTVGFTTTAADDVAMIAVAIKEVGAQAFTIDASPGSYALTGVADKQVADRLVGASPGSYALTGVAAGLALERTVLAAPGSYALSGSAAGLLADRLVGLTPGSYGLTGDAADLALERTVLASPGSYALTGQGADVLADRVVSTVPGAYAVTGAGADLLADRSVAALPGAYTLEGVAADLVFESPGLFELLADPGAFALAGVAAGALADRKVDAAPASFTLSGTDAGTVAGRAVLVAPGSFVLTGAAVALAAAIASHIGTVAQSDRALASVALSELAPSVTLEDVAPSVGLSDRIST